MSATVFWNSSAEIATCSNVFDVAGTPADPTALTLTVTDPAGTVTIYNWPGGPNTLTHSGAGSFTQDVPCSAAADGIWAGLWKATGAASDAAAFTWTVTSPRLNLHYCGAEELKSRLSVTTTEFDSEITLAVAASSRAIDGYCERFFYRSAETRTYVPKSLYETRTDDLVSITALATDPAGTTAQGGTFPIAWPAASYQLLPYNPGSAAEPAPYTRIRAVGGLTFPWVIPLLLMRMDRVQVTGVFGWPAVPQVIRTMSLIIAAEVFRMKDTPMGGGEGGEFATVVIQNSPFIRQALDVYSKHPFLAA